MILPSLYIDKSLGKGRGVFTSTEIAAQTIVEISPVIVMSDEERQLLDKTALHDYIFEWGKETKECCMAMGYIPVYNHSYTSNCEYEMNFEEKIMRIKTVRKIETGEELFINYNGDWNNEKTLWFEAK
jgi:SET domain-containing protein